MLCKKCERATVFTLHHRAFSIYCNAVTRLKGYIMRRIHINRLAALICALLAVAALTGCGAPEPLERPMPSPGRRNIRHRGKLRHLKGRRRHYRIGHNRRHRGHMGRYFGRCAGQQDTRSPHDTKKHRATYPSSSPFTEEQLSGMVDMQGFISCAPSYYHKQSDDVYSKIREELSKYD